MGEMPPGRQRQAENCVAGLQQCKIDSSVGLRARMRLDVGKSAIEQLFGAIDRELLGHIHEFATAVVAAPGIPFCIFVRHHRTGRFENRARNDIFRGDQFDLILLAGKFATDRFMKRRVRF